MFTPWHARAATFSELQTAKSAEISEGYASATKWNVLNRGGNAPLLHISGQSGLRACLCRVSVFLLTGEKMAEKKEDELATTDNNLAEATLIADRLLQIASCCAHGMLLWMRVCVCVAASIFTLQFYILMFCCAFARSGVSLRLLRGAVGSMLTFLKR